MTDIKIKRYADKENLKKLMKYSKDTFANKTEINENYYTKEQVDTMLEGFSGGGGGTGGTVNNATLTIQKNGTNVATFTSNSNTDVAANITVPTKVSELTNDSGFLTSHQSLSNYVTLNGAQTISGAKTFTGNVIGINKNGSTEDANSLYSTTVGSKLTYYTTTNGNTTLANVPAAVNTTLESRTIRSISDSDWIVEQICHNSNGLYYRKGSNGKWGAWKTFAFTDDVDLSNYYTKSEVDNLWGSISVNSITIEEIEEICVL